ncbi:Chorismate dehydratase [Poriferisphaera corsica]|uniref:Chorismate dehydratase n=1 Tax=Poriferisphaera corsica TaxID=2528020 RepID=A0A517YTX3_9BACT|nr:menaquinone biosynthesis protein [Poriferisphaera corsica]QDU33676.1 Chorismate dehydratase [Poriferisphaera corsica]
MTEPNLQTVGATKEEMSAQICRVGCVSYLNSKPLIEGLEDITGVGVSYRVPADLIEELEEDKVDIALCPVIDYFRSQEDLVMVPSSGIGCAGQTLTVRLFSRVPIPEITEVYADTESHTSVALLKVILQKTFHIKPKLVSYIAKDRKADGKDAIDPEAMLLIGDKVVNDAPCGCAYKHQLDLGQAWWEMTGKPFVFALWMTKKNKSLGQLPLILSEIQIKNSGRIKELAEKYAEPHGWPMDWAERYLGEILKYPIGQKELEGIKMFAEYAHELGLITELKKMTIYAGERF